MFYEPASDFFFDPKTKLYYSNKKQKYFQFVEGMDPEFQAMENQQQGGGAVAAATSVGTIQADANGGDKSKIAISLKTTTLSAVSAIPTPGNSAASKRSKLIEKLRKASSASAPSTNLTEPQVHKKHAKDIDVWSNRIKEMKGEGADAAANLQKSTSSEPTAVKTTASGQPICMLCRRKFANVEKLRQHEQLSDMHKENLAKKADAEASKVKETATPEMTYRDRTKERQMMYSTSSGDAFHVDKLLASVNPAFGSVETKSEVIRPEQTLGDSNVGNQLLQKMGWKSGEALGRKQEGENGAESKSGSNVANNLKNDWERIESLAQAGGRGRP
jgi:RNA-binding protein 5/10